MSDALRDLRGRISDLEESYEFFLAYAAQGVSGDGAAKAGQIRDFLSKAEAALSGMAELFRTHVRASGLEPADVWEEMLDVLERDTGAARAAVALVAAQPSIPSQLVDNLNANIHVRATLTDLFLLDDVAG